MNVYFVRDKLSGQVVDVILSENLDTYKRQFINAYLSLKEKNNFAAIRLWNDSEVYESWIETARDGDLLLGGDCTYSDNKLILDKVLVIKDFIAEFESKKGSNLDKSE